MSSVSELQELMAKDLSRLYNVIYNNTKDIEVDNSLGFLALNSLHMHNHAIGALKRLLDDATHVNRAFSLAESPLYSLLLPIAAYEYDIDLLSVNKFSNLFHTVIDNMLELDNTSLVRCCNYIPYNYMLSSLQRLKTAKSHGENTPQEEGISRLLKLFQSIYPDHLSGSKIYLLGLIEAHRSHQSASTNQIPVDSTFFRTFGHTIFQPDWLAREFRIASSFFIDKILVPTFLNPRASSLLGKLNHVQSNRYILDGWIEVFRRNPSFGRFTTYDELTESYEKQRVLAFVPYEYSLSEVAAGNPLTTYNKTGAVAYERTKNVIQLSLGDAIKRLEPRLMKPRISNRKTAILHVRSGAFYGDMNHRNSNLANYGLLCDYLICHGYDVYNYSTPELHETLLQSMFNYYDYKTKRLDALIVSSADLIISTPSGIGATGRLFGVSELVTNFWPYIFDGVPSALKVIPKIVIDRELGRVLSPPEVISLSLDIGLSTLEEHPRYTILENSENDLLLGFQDFQNGRMISLSVYLPDSLASAPESFVKKYFDRI